MARKERLRLSLPLFSPYDISREDSWELILDGLHVPLDNHKDKDKNRQKRKRSE